MPYEVQTIERMRATVLRAGRRVAKGGVMERRSATTSSGRSGSAVADAIRVRGEDTAASFSPRLGRRSSRLRQDASVRPAGVLHHRSDEPELVARTRLRCSCPRCWPCHDVRRCSCSSGSRKGTRERHRSPARSSPRRSPRRWAHPCVRARRPPSRPAAAVCPTNRARTGPRSTRRSASRRSPASPGTRTLCRRRRSTARASRRLAPA